MNHDWFVNELFDHCYGVKTEDNMISPNSHCAYLSSDNLYVGTTRYGYDIDGEKPVCEISK